MHALQPKDIVIVTPVERMSGSVETRQFHLSESTKQLEKKN